VPGLPLGRLKAQIIGTKPVLRDPGWKSGQYESKYGLISDVKDKEATFKIGFEVLHVPAKYVVPVRPSMTGEFVVVLSGPLATTEYTLYRLGASECSGKPRNQKGPKVKPVDLQRETLCVVCR
jgi:hypothetical protein